MIFLIASLYQTQSWVWVRLIKLLTIFLLSNDCTTYDFSA